MPVGSRILPCKCVWSMAVNLRRPKPCKSRLDPAFRLDQRGNPSQQDSHTLNVSSHKFGGFCARRNARSSLVIFPNPTPTGQGQHLVNFSHSWAKTCRSTSLPASRAVFVNKTRKEKPTTMTENRSGSKTKPLFCLSRGAARGQTRAVLPFSPLTDSW